MNAHALQVLEFQAALAAVASRCAGELGREEVLARRPGTHLAALQAELDRVWAGVEVHRQTPAWAPPAPPDARRSLKVLEREGGVLAASELLLVLRLLEASGTLARELPSLLVAPDSPLEVVVHPLLQDPAEEDRLRSLVGDDGVLRDGASPLLRQLRRKIQAARSRIVRKLEGYVASLPERVRVADASVSVREGRYVIQVRREGKSEVGGIIHGESSTGATLFVEPPLALQLMSEILELEREEDREVQRILREVSNRLRPRQPALAESLQALVAFDSLWARVVTADRWKAHLPELVSADAAGAGAGLRVVQGRHPLLLEQAGDEGSVVPFSLELDPHERALVISGPNTGGKTVFLKAMGLLPLLAQSGILPPVGPGTRLPVVRNVFADIGDEQSIAESLSTFSAHLANARQILQGAGPGTLVLMDEMGTGTDPAEGAALAQALLETLVERGALALVTSHLGAMKRLDTPGSGIVNGSLLFDPDRIEPTYRFQKGRPGRSYGLAIARRLGFPAEVLDRAEGYVSSGELEVETLLASLEQKESALAEAVEAGEKARREAEALRQENTLRARELERREKGAEARARDAARQYLMEAREEVEAAIRQLRETAAADAAAREALEREARKRVEEAARAQGGAASRARSGRKGRRGRAAAEATGEGSSASTPPAPGPPLAPGDRVRLLGSGARGTIQAMEGDRLSVEVGSLRFDLHRDEVERLEPASGQGRSQSRSQGRSQARSQGRVQPQDPPRGGGSVRVPEVVARPEVHLLGLRVDEVELELGRALDGAVLGHLSQLRIVHGKGTGAVKARVHELLRIDPRVLEFRGGVHGEGGAGVTVAVLG